MKQWISVALLIVGLSATLRIKQAEAVQLDWNGQFWFENHWLNNYQLSRATPGYDSDQALVKQGGQYVPGNGEKNSVWYDVFFKLKPKLIVNDSLTIKSELHIGSPIYGFYGRGTPNSGDEQFNFTGSSTNNFSVSAQRYWANLVTDFGTIELGRAPLHWGLGAIWNAGDNLFDKYQSTGDMVRLTSKFGNFSVQPALVKVALGNNVSGAQDASGNTIQGNDDVTDYDLAVKYDNSEEEFEFGMMWTKRSGNTAQRSIFFNKQQTGSTRINFSIFDFYSRKKWGHFWFGGELPLFNGNIGAIDGANEFVYKTFAVMFEGGYSSDLWDVGLKLGHVPGEQPTQAGDNTFRAVYLNKDYKLGLLMFNYNLFGLNNNNPDTTTVSNLKSPYDAEIVNANYLAINPQMKLDKWTLKSTFVMAFASSTAQAGSQFYNYQQRQFFNAINNQSSFMGWEGDLGVAFKWDENVVVGWDFGCWFPGGYYQFTNDATLTKINTSMMFGSVVRAGVTF